jgi:hypothetical protein
MKKRICIAFSLIFALGAHAQDQLAEVMPFGVFHFAGERVLVVAGQGHTAILKDFLEIDRRISSRDIQGYL